MQDAAFGDDCLLILPHESDAVLSCQLQYSEHSDAAISGIGAHVASVQRIAFNEPLHSVAAGDRHRSARAPHSVFIVCAVTEYSSTNCCWPKFAQCADAS